MRIGVTCTNLKKHLLRGHAGRTARFLIYEVEGEEVREVDPITLEKEDIPHFFFHERGGRGPHPLFDHVDVLLVESAGRGFVNFSARLGVKTILTDMTDPDAAVLAYLNGTLAGVQPEDHHHGHDHHDHDHGHHHHDHDHGHHHHGHHHHDHDHGHHHHEHGHDHDHGHHHHDDAAAAPMPGRPRK